MPRVKKGVHALKRRRNVLAAAKGFRFGRSKKEIEAKVAIRKAGAHALAHRRDKKNDFKRLWNVKINAALEPMGLSYSKVMGNLKKKNISLNRKMLAEIAQTYPEAFIKIAELAK